MVEEIGRDLKLSKVLDKYKVPTSLLSLLRNKELEANSTHHTACLRPEGTQVSRCYCLSSHMTQSGTMPGYSQRIYCNSFLLSMSDMSNVDNKLHGHFSYSLPQADLEAGPHTQVIQCQVNVCFQQIPCRPLLHRSEKKHDNRSHGGPWTANWAPVIPAPYSFHNYMCSPHKGQTPTCATL